MNVLVLRTNIDDEQKLKVMSSLLNDFQEIKLWSLDQEDVDKVLRIEASESLTISSIAKMLNSKGLICEELE
jgi:hypothetical protein